ncbi:LysR family transcriptional regulator [Pseudomonas sp. ANT_J12]|nr:LysR family transcriptional regulator [Pseudomonas sp. ANT_J12]
MGASQTALSRTLRHLEEQLGVQLLTRSTRSLSPTEAGERLIGSIGPYF